MYEPPKVDREGGVVYFNCPEWMDCEDCLTYACPLHPSNDRACFNCKFWEPLETQKHIPIAENPEGRCRWGTGRISRARDTCSHFKYWS